MTHMTITSVTLYLHREQSHKSVKFHPVVSHLMRLWLWLTTGMNTRQWVAVHRRHHQSTDQPGDPHSPHVFGLLTEITSGMRLYNDPCRNADFVMKYGETKNMNKWFLMANPEHGKPYYYNFNGVDSNGDTLVDFYPIPDGVYNVRINLIKSQVPLSNNSDKPLVPAEPIIFGAYARALAERGEDGGLASSEAYQLYKSSLADFVAIEANHYPEELEWSAD